jgi:MFS family permease
MALMLASSLLPTPLFQLYHRTWNLTTADTSIVFATYAASLIPSLLFLGRLSDSIGRRRTERRSPAPLSSRTERRRARS